MNIELYVSQDNHVVLACSGRFKGVVESVFVNRETHLISLNFEDHNAPFELNCAVDHDVMRQVQNEEFCALGFFEYGKIVEAKYVPLEIGTKQERGVA